MLKLLATLFRCPKIKNLPKPCNLYRNFATVRNEGSSTALTELLDKELAGEQESFGEQVKELPVYLKDFLKRTEFRLMEEKGESVIELYKFFSSKEKVTIRFSLADLLPSNKPTDPYELKLFASPGEYPINCQVLVSKYNKGCLRFDTVISDQYFGFSGITLYNLNQLQPTIKHNLSRLNDKIYTAPFSELEEKLKSDFEEYLEQRGIDDDMADFIRGYIAYKEQLEYMDWLRRVKTFVKSF